MPDQERNRFTLAGPSRCSRCQTPDQPVETWHLLSCTDSRSIGHWQLIPVVNGCSVRELACVLSTRVRNASNGRSIAARRCRQPRRTNIYLEAVVETQEYKLRGQVRAGIVLIR